MWLGTPLLAPGKDQFYTAMLSGTEGPLSLVSEMGALKLREQPIKARFIAVPKVDYVGTKGKIESLNTQALAEYIDERFIEFYDTKKNDALALGKIIREKKRFPIDKFADIQRAFPCIIAGLRDYAEFIPLEREIFDLVIIDEASQVQRKVRTQRPAISVDLTFAANVRSSSDRYRIAALRQASLRANSGLMHRRKAVSLIAVGPP